MISKPKPIISSLLKNILATALFLLVLSFNNAYAQQAPSLEITSYSDLLDADDNNLVGLNDVLSYSITVKNTGNIELTSLALTAVFIGLDESTLTLESGPTYSNSDGSSSEGTLDVGETATYVASYTFNQAGIDAGGVAFSIIGTASSPGNTNDVTDQSDNANDSDGNALNDSNVTTVGSEVLSLVSTKEDNVTGELSVGDVILYTITVTNDGNTSVTNVTLFDDILDLNGNVLVLIAPFTPPSPIFISSNQGSEDGSLLVGETAEYTATYILEQSSVDAGGVSNCVLASAGSDASATDVSSEQVCAITEVTPYPSIQATKVASVIDNGDEISGPGDTINYTIYVKNTGDVTLTSVTVTDTFEDYNGNTLTLATQPTFTGSSNLSLEGTLNVSEIATYTASYLVTANTANSGGVRNSILASGFSPDGIEGNEVAVSIEVTDVSDDNDDTDGNTENDKTETTLSIVKSLDVTKTSTVTDTNADGDIGLGDTVNYTIQVKNNGEIELTDVSIVDTLTDCLGVSLSLTVTPAWQSNSLDSSQGTLIVGEIATYSASYVIIQDNIESGCIKNSVTATGSSPGFTNDVTDLSDDGIDNDGNLLSDQTVTNLQSNPSLEVTKTATVTDNGDGVPGAGDTIVYTITVENNGNISAKDLVLSDVMTSGDGTTIELTTSPSFVSSSQGSAAGILNVGEIATYTATYLVTSTVAATEAVNNQVTVNATSFDGETPLSDVSDDGDDNDGNTQNDETIVPLIPQPSIEVTKTSTTNATGVQLALGNTITYTITVENTGNVIITDLSFVDQFSGFSQSQIMSLTNQPQYISSTDGSSPEGTLLVGETATYTANFVVDQLAFDNSGVQNAIQFTGSSPGNTGDVTDISDDGIDTDGNIINDPTVNEINSAAGINAVKTSSFTDNNNDDILNLGDVINYTILIKNTGNVTLSSITLSDELLDANNLAHVFELSTGPNFVSSDQSSVFGTLLPNETATYTATVTVTQEIVNYGGVKNRITVTALDPSEVSIIDLSDDGNNVDGNTEDDYTEDPITRTASLDVTKTSAIVDNGDGITGLGDTINYTILVNNTGNVNLSSIDLTDYLTTASNASIDLLTGPTFVVSSAGSDSNNLLIGETATYTASYVIMQESVDSGGVYNSVTVTASTLYNTISDVSDDGDDTDGNTENDKTEVSIVRNSSLDVTKTVIISDLDNDGLTGVNDVANYTITIVNTGNASLTDFNLVDILTDVAGNILELDAQLVTAGGATLLPGATLTYTASYTIEQSAVDEGGVKNSVVVTAFDGINYTNDTSDDGNDDDGNTVDDTTDVLITANPSIEVTKTVESTDNDGDGYVSVGDLLTYTILIENTGNTKQESIQLEDTITDFDANVLSLNSASSNNNITFISSTNGSIESALVPGEIATYQATYTVTSTDVIAGGVSNTLTVTTYEFVNTSTGLGTQLVSTDVSDDGDDTDGNTTNDPTNVYTGIPPSMEAVKTYSLSDTDASGGNTPEDIITFTITLENTGQDILSDISFVDTSTNAINVLIALSSEPTFVSSTSNSAAGTLQIGETATYTASHAITQADIAAGGIFNSIEFMANSARNPDTSVKDVKDVSDNGIDSDGNTENDRTFVILGLDSDGDGYPDTIDVDDDNDGILDEDESCLDFLLDGNSFESYTGAVPPITPGNKLTSFPISNAPPFSAVNLDGEIWTSGPYQEGGPNFNPHSGLFYVELLQNANGANNLNWWDENTAQPQSQVNGYDRIVVIENVLPNTSYSIDFYHKDGGRLESTHVGGGSTLLQVQSMQTDTQTSLITDATPDWSAVHYEFTTDGTTSQVAILLSPYGPGLNISIQLDSVTMDDVAFCNPDIDNDGIPNSLDLDSDNDGIYDVVEAGLGHLDTNNDGRIDANDTGYTDTNFDGVNDSSFSNVPTDSDNDGIHDSQELDSDNDGCFDSSEAGFTDGDNDGILGNSPATQDLNGKVSSGVDGYTTPQDLDSNTILDYIDADYDVGCYNPSLDVTKTAVVTDTNGDGLTNVGDVVTYTINVQNTSFVNLQISGLTDELSNGNNTPLVLTPVFESRDIGITIENSENLLKSSSFSSAYANNLDYWVPRSNSNNSLYNSNSYAAINSLPTDEPFIYDSSSGISASIVPADWSYGVNTYSDNSIPTYLRPIRMRNNTNARIQQENFSFEANTTYTFSVYTKNYANTTDSQFRFFVNLTDGDNFPIDSQTLYSEYKTVTAEWTRHQYTFTSGDSASIGAIGITNPSAYYEYYWGAQLERNSKASYLVITGENAVTDLDPYTILDIDPSSSPGLVPNEIATYSLEYTITQDDIDAGNYLSNSVTVSATYTTPSNISGSVQDISDDNDDTDGNTSDDPTVTSLDVTIGMEVTKTAEINDVNEDGQNNVGDIINYTISIENQGTTSLTGLSYVDTLSDINNNVIDQLAIGKTSVNNLLTYSRMSQIFIENDGNNFTSAYVNEYHPPSNIDMYLDEGLNGSYVAPFGYGFVNSGTGISFSSNNWRPVYIRSASSVNSWDNYYSNQTLEANTTYTLSVYAKKYSTSPYSEFKLFAYDGMSQNLTSGESELIINNSLVSEPLIIESTDYIRYSFTFTTGLVNNTGTGNIARTRVGFIVPQEYLGGGTDIKSLFWGMQLEKSPSAGALTLTTGVTFPETLYELEDSGNYTNWATISNNVAYNSGFFSLSNNTWNTSPESSKYPSLIEYPGLVTSLGESYNNTLTYNQWSSTSAILSTNNYATILYSPTTEDHGKFKKSTYNGYYGKAYIEVDALVTSLSNYSYLGQYNGHSYFKTSNSSHWISHQAALLTNNLLSTTPPYMVSFETQEELEAFKQFPGFNETGWTGLSRNIASANNDTWQWYGNLERPFFKGQYNGHSYFVSPLNKNYTESNTYAESLGAQLYSPNSANEDSFIASLSLLWTTSVPSYPYTQYSNFWMGVYMCDTCDDYLNDLLDGTYSDGSGWRLQEYSNDVTNSLANVSLPNSTQISSIAPGETQIVYSSHTITQSDLDNGGVSNTVTITAEDQNISDISDDGDDTDGNTEDDPTITLLDTVKEIEVVKTAVVEDVNSNGLNDEGDIITYTIAITNNGNVTLSDIDISDQLTDADDNSLTLTSGPTYVSSCCNVQLENLSSIWASGQPSANYYGTVNLQTSNPGLHATADYSAYKFIIENDLNEQTIIGFDYIGSYNNHSYFKSQSNSSSFENAMLIAESKENSYLWIIDSVEEWETIYSISGDPGSSGANYWIGLRKLDDIWQWIGKDSNETAIADNVNFPFTDVSGATVLDDNTIEPQITDIYTATYTIEATAIESGVISNSVTVTGSSPGNTGDVTDVSDDDDDTDGNLEDDSTDITSPYITVTKTAVIEDTNSDEFPSVGDTISYTITVENTGGETLSNMTLVDTLTDANASVLSLTTQPTFVSSTLNSEAGTLLIDEIATYSASYIITQEAFDSGSILNSVVATATGLAEIAINDTSDNGDDTDGNTEDDQTIVEFGSIKVVKTAVVTDNNNNELNDLGDTIAYTITIQNTGNITLTNPVLVDVLTDSAGNTLVLNSGPTFISSTTGSSQNSILADGILTYSATHQISSVSDDTAFISNTVTVTASSPGYTNDISDISDDGDDTDGNTEDDETKVVLAPDPEMEITKTYVVTDNNNNGLNDLGDGITYTITVKNTGNLNLTGLILNDILTDYNGNVLSLQSGPNFVSADQSSEAGTLLVGETATFTAFYAIEQTAVDNGGVKNTVIGTASSPGYTNDVTDTSDDGDDTDGNTIDDQTEIIITPLPSLEVTKTVVLNDLNSNGFNDIGDRIDFIISVENNGNIILTDLNLLDTFTDHLGNSFTLSDGPTFVSSTMESLVGTLQAGEIANYLASFIIDQAAVDIGSLNNSVLATASSPGNTDDVTDISDDGDDADGNIEDDDTVVDIYSNSLLEVVKIANVTDSNDNQINDIGDIINYTISVTNTGNTNLTGVNLVDTITNSIGTELVLNSSPGFINSSQNSIQGTILIGETATYTASFIINDIAFNSEYISNSVTAYASSEGLTDNVTDISDDGDDTDGNTTDDPTITFNDPTPSIEATKTFEVIDNGDGLYNSGDIIKYTITFENTGNAPLTGLNFTDNISDGTGTVLSLTDGPFYSTSSLGSAQGSLNINEIATYIAFYTINNSSAESGSVINSVTVNASSPGNTNDVTDISDDGDDTDGNTTNDPTILNITSNAAIKVVKTAVVVDNNTNDVIDLGDTINYTISVTNNGEETLTGLFLTDLLTDGNGQTLTLSVEPTYQSSTLGSSVGNLLPSEQANYTAAYIITQSDVDSGLVRNSVLATASSPVGINNINDVSDDGISTDGNTTDDPTDIILTYETGIEVVKTSTISDNGDDVNGLGDTITYTIQVTNTGNVLLTDVIIVDTLTDANGNALTLSSGPNHIGSTLGSSDGVLQANETATYIAFYVIGQTAVDNAGVSNTATATGSSPGNSDNVTDVSDDGDDTDGNTSDDSTDQILTKAPSINVTKTATVVDNNNNEINDFGDTINYTILVMNTGNVSLSSVTINDVLTNADGTALSLTTGPSFVSSNQNSTEGTLKVGETSTYNASYTIQSIGSDSGSILNTVTATASSPDNTSDISDISDNGDDTDGNLIDDSTEVITTAVPSMEVTKTYSIIGKGDEGYGIGDIIQYNITVENTGNVSLSSISLNDILSDANGVELTLTNGPFFSGSNQQSGSGTLKVGETATYIAFYVINQAVVDAGGLSNTVTVTASSTGNTEDIIDISDDGDDTDGNTTDDPTEYTFTAQPSIEAIKTATVIDNGDNINGPGDTIQYTISIINTGNVTLTDVSINDILTDANELALTLTSGPGLTNSSQNSVAGTLIVGETATYTATYLITDLSASTGSINNSVVATASSPNGTDDVTDESDNGNDTDGNTVNDSTTVLISSSSSLEVTKTAIVVDNGDNVNGSGDTITYTITVENTGNTILTGVGLVDTLTDGNNAELSLTSGPSFSGNDGVSNEGTLKVGETATYTATYLITDLSSVTGSINNSVLATASSPNGTNDVTDVSDNGNDTDGNTINDITTITTSLIASIEVTKTATVVDNGDNVNGIGDVINYSITVENNGSVSLTEISLSDTFLDGDGNALTIVNPAFVSSTQGSVSGILLAGEVATYSTSYTIIEQTADTGFVSNSVTAIASTVNGTNDVSDVSDDGDDTDGNTTNDPTITVISSNASIEVTKTATIIDNGDELTGAGDIIQYTISVKNTGNIILTNLGIVDILTDGDGESLSITNGPFFSGSNQGSAAGTLQVGEVATYIAYYTITSPASQTGSIINTATATASSPGNTNDVTDISDDGDDTDGNTLDDTTDVIITPNPTIEVTKTAELVDNGDGINGSGDTITYTIAVENTGNVALSGLALNDTITDADGNALILNSGPSYSSSDQTSAIGTLIIGETETYTATYIISSTAANTGGVYNSVTATATSPGNTNDVTDISDDGDDTDGNTSDDTTNIETNSSPSIQVTKTATIVDNGDGQTGLGDTINYAITVENTGNVSLTELSLVDTLTDGNGNAIDLSSGLSFESSSLGSANGILQLAEVATYSASYVISEATEDTGFISNTVLASASSPDNTNDITDISDDGDDTDGNTIDDPTIITTSANPSIEVVKFSEIIDNGDLGLGIGDIIKYTIYLENTGNVDLSEVSIVDTLSDFNNAELSITNGPYYSGSDTGASQGNLVVGDVATYIAFYTISQQSIDAGGVSNSVTVTASSPGNTNDVTDISDDGDDTDGNTEDDPTEISIDTAPAINVVKTAVVTDNGDGYNGAGDVISYTITVANTGNVTLSGLTLEDTLTDADGNTLSLSSGPSYSRSTQSNAQGTLDVDEVETYVATYLITQTASDTQSINNTVLAKISSPNGTDDVTDRSDDGDDTDGETEDDETVTLIPQSPSIEVTKTAIITDNNDDGENNAGDLINYTITVENTGLVNLTNLALTDTLLDGNSVGLTLTTEPTFSNASLGSPQGSIAAGEVVTYLATYTIEQAVSNTGLISNSVTAIASSPGNNGDVTDISDDGDDTDGNTEDDPTLVQTAVASSINVTKTVTVIENGDGLLGLGDTVVYTIRVKNTGSASITGVTLEDTFTDTDENTLSLTTPVAFDFGNLGSSEGNLLVGETAHYTATFVLDQSIIDIGGLINQVLATGSSPTGTQVSDVSDDGDDTDGNTEDDPTLLIVNPNPIIETTKTASINDNGDGELGLGDTIEYTITVENLGNVTLSGLTLEDTLTDGQDNTLTLTSGPSFESSTMNSLAGDLQVGEMVTYLATYVIDQAAVDSGQVMNTVFSTASTPNGTDDVTDRSDDGDDTDGETEDDETVTLIPQSPSIEVTKTAIITDNNDDGENNAGDLINYTITVENTGDVTLTGLILEDVLTDGQNNALNITSGPVFVTSDQGTTEGSLAVGETATYSATYVIDQIAVDSGQVMNSVLAVANNTLNTEDVTDISDDGDDTDGNTEDDPTVTTISQSPSIEVTKLATLKDNGDNVVGTSDIIEYTITVENTGDVTIDNLSLEDTLSDGQGNTLTLSYGLFFSGSDQNSSEGTIQVGETATYIAYYIIEQLAADSGNISNTVTATGSSPTGTDDVTDISDDGDDTDGNTEDDSTDVLTDAISTIEVTKTATITDNGDGFNGSGDIIEYTISVENTGNVTIDNINLEDTLTDGDGNSLLLSNGPFFAGSDQNSPDGTIQVGETATYIAYYVIDQSAADSGSIVNTAKAKGNNPNETEISDVSDDGDDTDGNTEDDPTVVTTKELEPSIEVTKTATITDNGDGITGLEDVINYTITVENTGSTILEALGLVDTLSDISGNSLTLTTGPIFSGSNQGSTDGTLAVGETATYVATYVINAQAAEAGGVSNTVTAAASSPTGTQVSDVSDDGDDTDGNTSNDPTITELYQVPVDANFEIFNGITPNNDGNNDYFKITGIEYYPNNNVKIFNRWGVLVYETENYGILGGANNLFVGISEGRITYKQSQELPTGTYFYIISFQDSNPGQSSYTGYIYINRD